ASLAEAGHSGAWSAGTLRLRGKDRGTLLFESRTVGADGKAGEPRVLEIGTELSFSEGGKIEGKRAEPLPPVKIEMDDASVVLVEGKRRFRLPKGDSAFDRPFPGYSRAVREVVTERSLLNAHGSFYMLPRPNSHGVARLKPVCTHDCRITDFCSWRGL